MIFFFRCIFVPFLFLLIPFSFYSFSFQSNQTLYLMHKGEVNQAFELYQEQYRQTKEHDFDLLQQLGLMLLEQGRSSRDRDIALLTVFGAGISANEKAYPILEDGLSSDDPQIQLVCLNFLAQLHDNRADTIINRTMASPYPIICLESLNCLALRNHPAAVGQAEALMAKVPPALKPAFPKIFAIIGNPSAIKSLRRLLNDSNDKVRIEAILSAAEFGRDDLLPDIRLLASQNNMAQQEACAIAFGILKDDASLTILERLSHSAHPHVRLAAYHSLYRLGKTNVHVPIEEEAKQEDVFAVTLLGKIAGSENQLAELVKSKNVQVRINAALALLERKDPRCLPSLYEILLRNHKDLACVKSFSLGRGLTTYQVISSAKERLKNTPFAYELSIGVRESILIKALELPEHHFLELAHLLFDTQQNDLIPVLVRLLENMHTPNAIALLQKQQQKIGAPLIRNYCNLALYRLKIPGPYADNLKEWAIQQQHVDLIRFRPFLPIEMREKQIGYQLTPEETSLLLIETFETCAKAQDDRGIQLLLHAIQHGNPKNKYALVGLLLRATQ